MDKKPGVGKPRERAGVMYYPIYYRFNGHKVINTAVRAGSEADAYRQLKERIADFHSTPKEIGNVDTTFEIVREALRRDIAGDFSNKKDSNYLVENTFTRLFIDFPKKHYPNLSSCGNLPIGFFRRYKSYF